MFHRREDQSGEGVWEQVRDAVHGDADPHAGSQGHVLADDAPVAVPGHALADFASEWEHEGFGAILDPAGAADRLAARRELASRFNVMPDGTVGVAHENRYRGERREIAGAGVGARTAGAETDANMTHRDTYTYPGHARTTAAFDPG